MIQPINRHLKIKPIAQKSLFENGKYEEMGEVLGIPHGINGKDVIKSEKIAVGDKVFFDSWRCSKYPTGEQDENGEEIFFWLVPCNDVRAIEKNGNSN